MLDDMSKLQKKTISYINFTPYENSGNILDYILENFQNVIVFSLKFHSLKGDIHTNQIQIFKKGKMIQTYKLFQLPVPRSVLFLLLPFRSLILFVQIILYSFLLKVRFKKIDYYFTVNAFTAWVGNILKKLRLVDKTIFWVWDYYPPIHENKAVMLMRWIYWQFDKAATSSDKVVFLNERLKNLRQDIGIISKDINYPVVSIGTNPKNKKTSTNDKQLKLVFLGVVKKSQGLEILFKIKKKLMDFPNIHIDVIGSGPDEEYFQKKSKQLNLPITFHGYIKDENEIDKILSNSTIGLACYVPDPSNVSYYGDPSKIKFYLSYGIPVVTTDVFFFSQEIIKEKAGVIINYKKPEQLINAINHITRNHKQFKNNALRLSKKYYFRKIYKQIFT